MAWKRVQPERDRGVRISLASQVIRGKRYGVAPCYLAGVEAVALKAGKDKTIAADRRAAWDWLRANGLTYREAQAFVREGIAIRKAVQ